MATPDPHSHSHHHDPEHQHGHNHSHDPIEVTEGASEYEIMVHAIKELLIEKGVITGVTNASGNFYMRLLPGSYRVTIRHDGFA